MLIWPSEHLRQVCADFRHRAFDISVYYLPSYFWQSLRGACNQTFVRLEFAEKYFL